MFASALTVFCLLRRCLYYEPLSRGAVGWPVVCDYCIS